jgi:hypothetical protein
MLPRTWPIIAGKKRRQREDSKPAYSTSFNGGMEESLVFLPEMKFAAGGVSGSS